MATPDALQPDTRSLLEVAVDIHTDLGRLATGLTAAGASPQAVDTLHRIDAMIAQIVKLLGVGHVGAEPALPGAAAGAPAPGPGPAAAAPPPAPGPEPQPSGAVGSPAYHTAALNLQAALAHAKAAQASQRAASAAGPPAA